MAAMDEIVLKCHSVELKLQELLGRFEAKSHSAKRESGRPVQGAAVTALPKGSWRSAPASVGKFYDADFNDTYIKDQFDDYVVDTVTYMRHWI
jgi:hypothetical protein